MEKEENDSVGRENQAIDKPEDQKEDNSETEGPKTDKSKAEGPKMDTNKAESAKENKSKEIVKEDPQDQPTQRD